MSHTIAKRRIGHLVACGNATHGRYLAACTHPSIAPQRSIGIYEKRAAFNTWELLTTRHESAIVGETLSSPTSRTVGGWFAGDTLDVELIHGTLEGWPTEACDAGKNWAAAGAELLAYSAVTQLTRYTWRLTNLKRLLSSSPGDTHNVGEPFALLDRRAFKLDPTRYNGGELVTFLALVDGQPVSSVREVAVQF